MFRATRILIAVLLAFGASFAATRSTVNVGGRSVITYAPSGASNPALIVSMHGMGIPASMNQGMMMFEKLADTAKFVVTYPEAAPGANLQWDLGSMKDVNFILAIIDTMAKKFNIDRNRVYVSGFSMGGMMSWYLTCKIPDKIAAAVPGDGYPMGRHVGLLRDAPRAGPANPWERRQFRQLLGFCRQLPPGTSIPLRLPDEGPDQALSGEQAHFRLLPGQLRSMRQERLDQRDRSHHGQWNDPRLGHTGQGRTRTMTRSSRANRSTSTGRGEAWNFMRKWSLTGATGVSEKTSRISGLPTISARMSEGRIRLESDVLLNEVKVLDLQGRIQSVWNAGSASDNVVTLPAGSLKRGVYMAEAQANAGSSVTRIMVP